MKCGKCGASLTLKSIFKWLNSGIKDFICPGCNRLIVDSIWLLIIFAVSGILMVLGIDNFKVINPFSDGLLGNDFISFGFLLVLGVAGLYISAYLCVRANA